MRLRDGSNAVADDLFFFFQAEDGIRDLVRSRGLGDVYKRQRPGLGRGLARGHRHAHGPADQGDPDLRRPQ